MKFIAKSLAIFYAFFPEGALANDPGWINTPHKHHHQVTTEEDEKSIRIGAAQAEPVHWNLDASINKFCDFIKAAGKDGAQMDIITFSEAFIAGYPWWNFWTNTFDVQANAEIQKMFAENSLQVGSEGFVKIQGCIAEAQVNVILPVNERDDKGSQSAIFNTALFFDKTGELVGRHRKTLPSFTERFWWSNGDGTDLVVIDMPDVGRVCSVLCWESYVMLARYTLMAQGCEFLFVPTQDMGPVWERHVSAMGREGRWYVIAQGQLMQPYGEAMKASSITSEQFGSQWYDQMSQDFSAIPMNCPAPPAGEEDEDEQLGANAVDVDRADPGERKLRGLQEEEAEPTCNKYFMDGGMTISDPNGDLLVESIYSNHITSVNKAKDGCKQPVPAMGGAPNVTHCEFFEVDGYNGDEEFIVVTVASRGKVLAAKTYQDNFGNYARTDIWKVTWDNAPREYISPSADMIHNNGLGQQQQQPQGNPNQSTSQGETTLP